jgi:hypothetical protein
MATDRRFRGVAADSRAGVAVAVAVVVVVGVVVVVVGEGTMVVDDVIE